MTKSSFSVKEDKNSEPVPMDLDSESESVKRDDDDDENDDEDNDTVEETADDRGSENVTTGIVVDAWTEGVNKLPPEPSGLCSASLQDRINKLYQVSML